MRRLPVVMTRSMAFALCCGLAGPATAEELRADPLESPLWDIMVETQFPEDATIVFDDRVHVIAPDYATDSLETPVLVEAPALEDVEEIIVFADLNPITRILEYYPEAAAPTIAFRFKIQQATPVRAAMRTADGVWHVGGKWINAEGGGCTAPSVASGSPAWVSRLGEVAARLWPRESSSQRLRMRVIHPMDTGLAAGIPVFHITDIAITSADGELLAKIEPFEPVSENPVLTVDLNHRGAVKISGRDNNGNRFSATVPAGPS